MPNLTDIQCDRNRQMAICTGKNAITSVTATGICCCYVQIYIHISFGTAAHVLADNEDL